MWLFFTLIFLTLFSATIFNTRTTRGTKKYLILMFSVLGILMMFRASSVGNDTREYARIYNTITQASSVKFFIENSRFEVGYAYLNRFLRLISQDSQILFIVTGLITAVSFGRFFYKYSKLPWLSVFMFITLQFFDLSMSGVRQILSISVMLFSYDYVISRKPIKFVFTVLLAASFHTSAIMFLLIYPLATVKSKKKLYWFSGVATVAVFFVFKSILPLIGRVFPRYIHYLTNEGNSYTNSATLAVFFMLLLWIILFGIAKGSYKENSNNTMLIERDRLLHNGKRMVRQLDARYVHEVAVWLSILMLLLALQGTILNRFKYIYSASLLVYYPNAMAEMNNRKNRAFVIAGTCAVLLSYVLVIYIFRPEWQSTYPYLFFWND